ncbi:MAG: sensor histidine kinase [Alphaproteobacteria bacterium]|nr:sensor histidine kinase [Alphaproteobacteria bacterium]
MPTAIRWLVFVLVLVLPMAAGAGVPLRLDGGEGRQDLAGHLEVLEDPSGGLTIDDVTGAEQAGRFVPLPGNLAAGFTASAFWLRFTVAPSPRPPDDRLLEVEMPYLDHVELFAPDGRGGFTATRLGDRLPFAERPISYRNFLFALPVPDDAPRTFHLRVLTTSTMVVKARVWSGRTFAEAKTREDVVLGVLHGALIALLLASVVQYLVTRDGVYRRYSFYVLFSELVFVSNNGLGSQFLFPETPALADALTGLATCGMVGAGTLFIECLFDLRRRHPWLGRAYVVLGTLALAAGLAVLADRYRWVAPINYGIALLNLIVSPMVALRLALRGDPNARVFLAAFAVYVVTAILLVLRNVGVRVVPDDMTDWGHQAGMVLHVLLLSFGLAHRLVAAERGRQAAQAELAARGEVELALIEAHERSEAALAMQRTAMREQRNFLAMVSHEFRTPLAIIAGSASLLSQYPDDPEDTRAETDKIYQAVLRVQRLIDSLLADDWLETATTEPRRAAVDLGRLVESVAAEYRAAEPLRAITVACPAATILSADPDLLRVLVANLIGNACKYSAPDSPVDVLVTGAAGMAELRVSDRGAGIRPEDAAHVFEKFFRAATAERRPGTGIGLHLVRRISELHGGSVTLASVPGEGATFTVHLPMTHSDTL